MNGSQLFILSTAAVALLFGLAQNLAQTTPSLPPLPPLPPGVTITAKTNRMPVKPLPPVPDPRGRTVRDRESVMPKARWTEGIARTNLVIVKHTFRHHTNTGTVVLTWPSEPDALYELDYAAGGHGIFYPWPERVGGWYGTNQTSHAIALPFEHPGWWRVRKL